MTRRRLSLWGAAFACWIAGAGGACGGDDNVAPVPNDATSEGNGKADGAAQAQTDATNAESNAGDVENADAMVDGADSTIADGALSSDSAESSDADAGDATEEPDTTLADSPGDVIVADVPDAPTDGALACATDGGACNYFGYASLCKAGTCSYSCDLTTDNAACSAAYGDGGGYVCGGEQGCDPEGLGCLVYPHCVPGNCSGDSQCPSNTPACMHQYCTACDPDTSGTYYVDPLLGTDDPAGGSGTAGGGSSPRCRFKTVAFAIQQVGASPPPGTSIIVVNSSLLGQVTISAATNGDSFPWRVPVNTALIAPRGAIGGVIAKVTAGQDGVILAQPSSSVSGFVIDGQLRTALHGIVVRGSADLASTQIANVTVAYFQDSGIRVEAGGVTLIRPVSVSDNGDTAVSGIAGAGMHVTGTGTASAAVGYFLDPLISFSLNAYDGVLVDQRGSVVLSGVGASPQRIQMSHNGRAGIEIKQDPSLGALTACKVTALTCANNTGGAGLLVHGGSLVEARACRFTDNAIGVSVQPFGGASPPSFDSDTSGIDLGTSLDGGVGGNVMQSPADGGANALVGLCIGTDASTNLFAVGNHWNDGDAGTAVDCRTTAAKLSMAASCDAGIVDIGLGSAQIGTTLRVDQCQ
jgi:hypothetical protein